MTESGERVDEDLLAIRALQDGDEAALLKLMERYKEPVFRLAYRYSGNAKDAQWLAEEVFAKVFFKASLYRPRASVKSWIFALAANHCRDFLRRERRNRSHRSLSSGQEREGLDLEETLPDPARDAARLAVQEERLQEIQEAIQALPEKLRFPFVFCVLEGGSHDEAAAILGATRKSVELRIYRARKALQRLL